MAQKQTDKPNSEELMKASGFVSDSTESPRTAINRPLLTGEIDRVLQILNGLPTLRRYGDDTSALKEAREILEGMKEKL